jgi:hypothetical protein
MGPHLCHDFAQGSLMSPCELLRSYDLVSQKKPVEHVIPKSTSSKENDPGNSFLTTTWMYAALPPKGQKKKRPPF